MNELDIPQGYKQTEVGVIPDDWECKTIKDITLDILQGVNTAIDIPEYVSDGIPMLKANNVIDQILSLESVDFVSEKSYLKYAERYQIKKGDFLFSNIGARLGTGSIFKHQFSCTFAWNVMKIVPNTKKVTPEFLAYMINSPSQSEKIKSEQSGSGMGFIPKSVMQNVIIAIPKNIKEQSLIATTLSDVDALICELEKLIAKKQAIKTASMQQLLTGKTRLPQFALHEDGTKKGYKQSELGEIPEGWDVFSLLDIANLVHGKAHEPYVVESGEYVVVNSKFVSTEGKVRKYCSQNDCAAKKGDILMVLSDLPNGKALAKCFYADQDHVYAVNQRVCIFRTNVFDSKYLQLIMNRHKYFLALDDGVTQTHILNGDIAACQLFAPVKREEQTAIATILSDMDTEIQALEQRLGKTRQIKQGMMQELLTGKTRLLQGTVNT